VMASRAQIPLRLSYAVTGKMLIFFIHWNKSWDTSLKTNDLFWENTEKKKHSVKC
jgi:hypothetical protein